MYRTLFRTLLCTALTALALCGILPVRAELPPADYAAVVLQARVVDRQGRPVANLPLRFTVDLNGVARQDDERSEGVMTGMTRTVRTDAAGVATLPLSGSPWTHQTRWFRGRAALTVTLPRDPQREISSLGDSAASETWEFPAQSEGNALPTLQIYEEPTQRAVAGFPVWAGNGRLDKIVVCLEGFDLYNRISASDLMQLISPASDALRANGVSVLIVHFPDSHLTPDKLAPRAAEAIEAAAQASGHSVAVVGLSAGGIIGRFALVEAEESGHPLPVNTFMTLDTPNRGARMNPQLQAIVLRYGLPGDKASLSSDAARVLISSRPADVHWKWIGLPEMGREMPVSVREDTTEHEAFYDYLRHLNNHNGYPKRPRLIGVATGSRRGGAPAGPLMHLWLPYSIGWTLPAAPADHAPGSLLPPYYVSRFTTVYPLGLAGATLRSDPTFIPTESALDAGPDETPPFDAWYARPDNAPAISHDSVDANEAKFVVGQLLASDWSR